MIGKIFTFKYMGNSVYFRVTEIYTPVTYGGTIIKSNTASLYKVGDHYGFYYKVGKEISEHNYNKILVFEE